jgi:hypothetical protein
MFCLTKICNSLNNKNTLLSIRIDFETAKLIAFLKQRKIRYTDIIRATTIKALKDKCKELEYKESNSYCPF